MSIALQKLQQALAQKTYVAPPKGYKTLKEYCLEWELSESQAYRHLQNAVKAGLADRISHKINNHHTYLYKIEL